MSRYAVFRSKNYYGRTREELDGAIETPPVPGAVADGEFWPYSVCGPDEACTRWVLELPDLASFAELSRTLGKELIFAAMPYGRYSDCGPELWDGIDGVIEVYDYYRE